MCGLYDIGFVPVAVRLQADGKKFRSATVKIECAGQTF